MHILCSCPYIEVPNCRACNSDMPVFLSIESQKELRPAMQILRTIEDHIYLGPHVWRCHVTRSSESGSIYIFFLSNDTLTCLNISRQHHFLAILAYFLCSCPRASGKKFALHLISNQFPKPAES